MYQLGQNQVLNNYQANKEADRQAKDSVYQENRMAVERDNEDNMQMQYEANYD